MSRPLPIDQPVPFEVDDLFFSTTDSRGVIVNGNDVFVRVSGYTKDELLHKPHSLIRHPDMPRAVFRLFWNYLESGKPIIAYVKNMAKSGRYYWVIALVQPIEGGYLSIRIKPTSAFFEKIPALYQLVTSIEEQSGMDAAANKLLESLKELGFNSYDDFMIHALNEELKAADSIMKARTGSRSASKAKSHNKSAYAKNKSAIDKIHLTSELAQEAGAFNQSIFSHIDEFIKVGDLLQERLRLIKRMTLDLGRIAINTAIQSDKIGIRGACLSVVAQLIQSTAVETAQEAESVSELATSLMNEVRQVCFNLGAAKIQIDMLGRFLTELKATSAEGGAVTEDNSQSINCMQLIAAFSSCSSIVVHSLGSFGQRMQQLSELINRLEEKIVTLEIARKSGVIEAHRIGTEGNAYLSLLEDVTNLIKSERQRLVDFAATIRAVAQTAKRCERVGWQIMDCLEQVATIYHERESQNAAA